VGYWGSQQFSALRNFPYGNTKKVRLKAKSAFSRLAKYADNTTLLVPSDSNIGLEEEVANIHQWASINKMEINLAKTKEIVLKRPNPRLCALPLLLTLSRFEQLNCLVLYCVTLCYLMNMFMPF